MNAGRLLDVVKGMQSQVVLLGNLLCKLLDLLVDLRWVLTKVDTVVDGCGNALGKCVDLDTAVDDVNSDRCLHTCQQMSQEIFLNLTTHLHEILNARTTDLGSLKCELVVAVTWLCVDELAQRLGELRSIAVCTLKQSKVWVGVAVESSRVRVGLNHGDELAEHTNAGVRWRDTATC